MAAELVGDPGVGGTEAGARRRVAGCSARSRRHGSAAKAATAAAARFVDPRRPVPRAVGPGDAARPVERPASQHPASMTHSTDSAEERARFGIGDGLVRLSIGLETTADLLADIGRALDAAYIAGQRRAPWSLAA